MRLLCLVFRASQLEKGVEARLLGVSAYLTARQQSLIHELWTLARTVHDKQTGSRSYDATDLMLDYLQSVDSSLEQELREGVIELNISLLS